MNELFLVRHGATDWNAQRRFQGRSDRSLNERGRAQTQALAAELADEPLRAVWSSPLRRAWDTAEAVAAPHGLAVTTEPNLRELDFGQWEGLTWDEIRGRDAAHADAWGDNPEAHPPPEGEALSALDARAQRVLARAEDAGPEARLAVVGSGGLLSVLVCRALGMGAADFWRVRMRTGTLARLTLTPKGGVLSLLGYRPERVRGEEG